MQIIIVKSVRCLLFKNNLHILSSLLAPLLIVNEGLILSYRINMYQTLVIISTNLNVFSLCMLDNYFSIWETLTVHKYFLC